ncbi:amidohydrolase family protein [Lishizhenia tianjinensis]|nr:adenosine deaminase [Lishizhenia tianjinensis]
MKKLSLMVLTLISAYGLHAQNIDVKSKNFKATSNYYNSIVEGDAQISLLNLFFSNMPKGADLHHHYTGSIYAETFLDWVETKNWSIDQTTLKIEKSPASSGTDLISVAELRANDALYRELLTLWSDKDYDNHYHQQVAPDQNFFNTFGYFGTVSDEYMLDGLTLLKERAKKENIQYLETMLSSVGVSSKNYPNADTMVAHLRAAKTQAQVDAILTQIDTYYQSDESYTGRITNFVAEVDSLHQKVEDEDFTLRYQSYTARVMNPLEVYTDLSAAFIASTKTPLIVGVNIVAPENNVTALEDYTLHMMMFNYLNRKYPTVHRALHAGELTLGMVRPKNLTFHINEAIHIAHAQRIGHGVDIPYESGSMDLIQYMKDSTVVVEINLTSNEFILGVKGQEHPYLIYKKYGVPMIISTDDSGVSRNNLSNQYMLLASRYAPSYAEIKQYVYNSIIHSFLTEEDKQREYKKLDAKFAAFEAIMAKN